MKQLQQVNIPIVLDQIIICYMFTVLPTVPQMFYTSPKPPSEYRLENVDETAFLKIIEFCYTSAISVTQDLAWPLLSAAALVELPEICGLCCDLLASDLSVASCLAMHLSAVRLSQTAAAQLLKASSQFLEDNIIELSTSQQLFDLNELELVELFKSLSQPSALACVKLATSWLSRSERSTQVKVVDQLKQTCPHLDSELTDFVIQTGTASPSAEDPSVDGKNDRPLDTSCTSSRDLSSWPSHRTTLAPQWNDSGYSEPSKRAEQAGEEDDQQHICIGCGDTFDSSEDLLAHRKRECEDEGNDVSQLKDASVSKDGQKVSEKQELSVGDRNGSAKDSISTSTISKTSNKKEHEGSAEKEISATSREVNLSECKDDIKEVEDSETNQNPEVEKDSTGFSKSEPSREKESLDINDSNNNGINAKLTDADSSDDIDVVNDDEPEEGSSKRGQAYSIYTEGLLGDRAKLGQNGSSGLKCQFCGLSVFDDEEELVAHWKDVHGVCQETPQQQRNRGNDGAGLRGQLDDPYGMSHSYLKRGYRADNEQESDSSVLKTLAKQPKLDGPHQEKEEMAMQVKKELSDNPEIKSSTEPWSAKPDDLRGRLGQEGDVAGFLQYMQQYNELAKWYMDQGFVYCTLCMIYHDKNYECPKSHKGSRHNPLEAQDPSSLRGKEIALNLKREKNKLGDESKSFNGTDVESLEKGKSTPSNGCEEEQEEEGPLDMSKTSQDFSTSTQYSSRLHSAKQATETEKEIGSHQSQESQYFSQHQMELAQYYSRVMAAVAAANGSTDAAQFGLAGPYGAHAPVPSGFSSSAMFITPTASTSDGGVKMSLANGSQDSCATHGVRPEGSLYGTSAASSPPGSVSKKNYGTHFKVPSDVDPFSPPSTAQSFHRRQQQNYHSAAHNVQDVSTATKERGLTSPASSAPFSLSPNDASEASQSSSNGKSQSGKKSGSRQGFPCPVCNRVFSYQASLFTHMRVHSPSARKYQCNLCHKTFDRAPDLKVHVCPNGVEKPYVCPSCGQTFAKNIHLKRHLATHSGLKPYPCWVCGKRFSRSDHLKRHTQSIHAGSRPHGCHLCGKEFVRKYELNKHMLIHTNIVAGEQADPGGPLLTNSHATATPQGLGEVPSGTTGPLTMQLPVTRSTLST
ncbi:zinc finger protein [Elysia marginata]|uniref:Zinc finger protein n=1 Tax=Elysia marginata TaxID=1093978 RepID=A0AAV4GDU6_9GAST|nr:zinc finger protein [Elysia marginata]